MASGNIQVTIGYDKKSLKALRKFAKRLDKCVRTLAGIRESMDRLKIKRVLNEPEAAASN